jgi:hypothetical protein
LSGTRAIARADWKGSSSSRATAASGRLYRQSAKTCSWAQAEAERRKVEARLEESDNPAAAAAPTDRKPLAQAIDLFVASKRNLGVSAGVIQKYQRELARLLKFMTGRSKALPS